MSTPAQPPAITGIVLAGGAAQRMGGADKGLLPAAGEALVQRVLTRLAPQVQRLCIVANRNLPQYEAFARQWGALLTCDASDSTAGFQGPLAGLLAGMAITRTPLALVVPVDAAHLPPDLAQRLLAAGAPSTVAGQPVCALLPTALLAGLQAAYAAGMRSPRDWLRGMGAAAVDFSDWPAEYWSVNTAAELAVLEAMLR